MRKYKNQDGITLLITLLLMGVLLGVSTSLLNVTLKQFQLSGVGYASEMAFQAANAGMECAQYRDWVNNEFQVFPSIPRSAIACFGDSSGDLVASPTNAASGGEQRFEFDMGTPEKCVQVSVYKYYDASSPTTITFGTVTRTCPAGGTCTVIQSRGYNTSCLVKTAGTGKIVERELTIVY